MVMYGLVWPYAAMYNFCASFQVCPKNEVAQNCPNNLRESQVLLWDQANPKGYITAIKSASLHQEISFLFKSIS